MLSGYHIRSSWYTQSPTLLDKPFSFLRPPTLSPNPHSYLITLHSMSLRELRASEDSFNKLLSLPPILSHLCPPALSCSAPLLLWVNCPYSYLRPTCPCLHQISTLLPVQSICPDDSPSLLHHSVFSLCSIFPMAYKYTFISSTLEFFLKNSFTLPSLLAITSSLCSCLKQKNPERDLYISWI